MLSVIPPTTRLPADVHLVLRGIPMRNVSGLNVESTRTVPRILPVYQIDVSTLVYMKTHVHLQHHVLFRTTMPSVHVLQAGLGTLWSPAHPRVILWVLSLNQNATQMETVLMTLPVSMRDVRTLALLSLHVM